jgi:hypothetical protein
MELICAFPSAEGAALGASAALGKSMIKLNTGNLSV